MVTAIKTIVQMTGREKSLGFIDSKVRDMLRFVSFGNNVVLSASHDLMLTSQGLLGGEAGHYAGHDAVGGCFCCE